MTDDRQAEEVASMLQAARAERFAPGFADRVMARKEARASAPVLRLDRSLGRTFLWMAPVALAATLVLAVLNMRSTGASGLDGVLGLPKVTLSAVYQLDSDVTASR